MSELFVFDEWNNWITENIKYYLKKFINKWVLMVWIKNKNRKIIKNYEKLKKLEPLN